MEKASEKQARFLQGSCMEMCPERERNSREMQRRLHPFEVVGYVKNSGMNKPPKANSNTAVKEFSRPAAGKELDPRDLRPASVLVKTMDYLLTDVLNRPSPLYYKCEFISDRIRAIRQDLTAQNIQSPEAIDILEKATRYYLTTAVKLSEEPVENYDPILHYTHMKECLKKLTALYRVHKSSVSKTCNQPSFEACNLLLNLDSSVALYDILRLNNHLRQCKEVQLAIHLAKLKLNGNFCCRVPNCIRIAIFRKLCIVLSHSANEMQRIKSNGYRIQQ